jgi:endo-1,4-beta-xylanase
MRFITVLLTFCGVALSAWWSGASAQSLREAAARSGVLMGTAVRPAQLRESSYALVLAREYNLLEPEDSLKWEVLRPERNIFDFTDADRIVAFAQLHGMKVRGHTLAWTRQNPNWLSQGTYSQKELRSLLREHIKKVVEHYRGRIFAWDVVNEAMDEKGALRSSLWYDLPGIGLASQGTAYIEQAFRWAHEADPHALLFYNDGGGEALNVKSDALYRLMADFKRRGVPIDGIGLQMHMDLNADVRSIARNLRRFAELGLQVHITEADVGVPVDANRKIIDAGDLGRQAELYRNIVKTCIEQRGCTAFQTWGFTDKYSWINSSSHGTRGAALLFDAQYRPKAAYTAVIDVLLHAEGSLP